MTEHEKLQALEGKNEVVGSFLTWLQNQGYVICEWEDDELFTVGKTTQQWIAEHFGIDMQRLSEEKDDAYHKMRRRLEETDG